MQIVVDQPGSLRSVAVALRTARERRTGHSGRDHMFFLGSQNARVADLKIGHCTRVKTHYGGVKPPLHEMKPQSAKTQCARRGLGVVR